MQKIIGNGSIYYEKNRKIWRAQYFIEENSKKTKKVISSKNKSEVIKKFNKIMYEFHNENYIQNKGMPLAELMKQTREDKYAANLISESHYSRLEYTIKVISNSTIGNMNITEISSRDLQDFFNSLIDKYSSSTIKKFWETTKDAFKTAVKRKYIKENPFEDIVKPRSKKKTKIVESMTVEQQKILSQYLFKSKISEEKYKNVILLQLYTGMRIGEVLALAPNDIDFNHRKIYVFKTISVNKDGELTIKEGAKTDCGNRELPIPYFLENALYEQIQNMENNPLNLLFSFERRIIKPSTINTVLKRICKNLGLPKTISNHVLRHTYGTRTIESGTKPVVLQRLMGHKDISVTLNTYTSVLNKFKEEELQKVADYYVQNDFLLPENSKNNLLNNNNPVILKEDSYEYETNNINTTSAKYIYKYPELVPNSELCITEQHIIDLFGSKENCLKEIEESEKIIEKFINKINKNKK